MSDNSHIQWTDATWQPITGCSVVSPGCTNCYAMRLAGGRLRNHPSRQGLTDPSRAGPVWNGKVRLNSHWLDQPLRWKKPRRIFVCAHGDLFHENVPDEWIDRVFAVMALAPQHQFQVLTKRAERMHKYLDPFHQRRADSLGRYVRLLGYDGPFECLPQFPLPNVWLGVSVEDQQRADERIPLLLDTPAAVRFVSAEPLLGPIDFIGSKHNAMPWFPPGPPEALVLNSLHGAVSHLQHGSAIVENCNRIDWVIVGSESGPGARRMETEWARSIVEQCRAAGVACFIKQIANERDRKGGDPQHWPEGEWPREMPA